MTPSVMVISWISTLAATALDPPVSRSAVVPELVMRKYPAVKSAPLGVARIQGWPTSIVADLEGLRECLEGAERHKRGESERCALHWILLFRG